MLGAVRLHRQSMDTNMTILLQHMASFAAGTGLFFVGGTYFLILLGQDISVMGVLKTWLQ